MGQNTALGAAFERSGITERDAEALVWIAKWQNNGGTYERLMEMARAAYGLPVEATLGLPQGLPIDASDRQQDGDVGQSSFADAVSSVMPASPLEYGTGQLVSADDGHPERARSVRDITPTDAAKVLAALPRHTRARRGLTVIARANKVLEASIMQSFKMPDGRGIGEVRRGEATRLIGDSRHQTFVLVLSQQYVDRFNPTADMLDTFADLIPVVDMERIVQDAARLCDEQEGRANAA